jgi:hypothetical protein
MINMVADKSEQSLGLGTSVFVPRFVVHAAGGGHAALVLAWLVAHDKEVPDGPPPAPAYKRLQRDLGLRKRQIDAALAQLEKKELIQASPGQGRSRQRLPGIVFHKRFRRQMKREGRRPKGIRVPVAAVRLTKTANQALLLSAICRRFELDGEAITDFRAFEKGKWWRANSHAQLRRETGLSEPQVRRALGGLKRLELIVADSFHVRGQTGGSVKTLHVRPNLELAGEIVAALPRRRPPDPPLKKRPQTKYKKPKDMPWLDVDQQWEEDVVTYLLDRYELSDTKAKGYLLKLAKDQDPSGPNQLTLAAFEELFPDYPLSLYAYRMSPAECQGLTVPKFFLDFENTVFMKAVGRAMLRDVRNTRFETGRLTLEAIWEDFICRPSAVILKWQRGKLQEQFVVRSWRYLVENVEGGHYFWVGNGRTLIVEPLWATFGVIDDKFDPGQQWKESPLYNDCLQPAAT